MARAVILTLCLLLAVDGFWNDSKYSSAFAQMTKKIATAYNR